MTRRGFTFIEVIAVVALLGILAGGTAYYLADQVQASSSDSAVGQLAYADRLTRLRARRLGRECVLRFDLDEQAVTRFENRHGELQRRSAGLNVPVRCRIEQVWTVGLVGQSETGAPGRLARHGTGVVDVAFSPAGRSATYALKLVSGPSAVWVVVAGLTGEVTVEENEKQLHNLFTTLATGRPDAD